jgi:hypothetical protein
VLVLVSAIILSIFVLLGGLYVTFKALAQAEVEHGETLAEEAAEIERVTEEMRRAQMPMKRHGSLPKAERMDR